MFVITVSDGTRVVGIVNDALVAPAGTSTSAGGWAAGLFDQTATVAPPVGAGPLRVIVPATWEPPDTSGAPSVRELARGELRNGFAKEKTSVFVFVSFATKLVEFEEKAALLPSIEMVATYEALFPPVPSAATFRRVNCPVVRSSRYVLPKETNRPSALSVPMSATNMTLF
jgi:hypothetical protein